MKRLPAVGLGALVAVVAIGIPAATATSTGADKYFVCKYVGKPGVNEVLQTGQNPISVASSAIEDDPIVVGSSFADAQGRSYVLAEDIGQPEPEASACPTPPTPTQGELVVNKVVVNNDGGTKAADDFSFTVNGGGATAFEADGSNSFTLDPGDYAVAEVAVEGYTSSGGGTVSIAAGETKTVTITNDDAKGEEPPPPHEVKGDASVSCILPDGHYGVSGSVDGQAADRVDPATIPGDTKGSTEVIVTRGDTSVKVTVSTNGDCGTAPTPPVVTPPAAVVTPPVQTAPTTPTTTTEPTAPLTPPTTTTKRPTTKKPAVKKPAAKTAPAAPKKAVAGAFAKEPPKLAYTP